MAGFTWVGYTPSAPIVGPFGRKCDDNLLTQLLAGAPINGGVATSGLIAMPQGLKPRHVEGVSSTGARSATTVYTEAAPLWAGTQTTWTGVSKSGAVETYTVTGYVGEKYTRTTN